VDIQEDPPNLQGDFMHDVSTELRKRFSDVCKSHNLLSESVRVKAKVLSSKEAIGNPESDDFPLHTIYGGAKK